MNITLKVNEDSYEFTQHDLPEGTAFTTKVVMLDKESGYARLNVGVLILPDHMNYDCPSKEFHELNMASRLVFRSFTQFVRTLKYGGLDFTISRPHFQLERDYRDAIAFGL